jgi:hypothetical protein
MIVIMVKNYLKEFKKNLIRFTGLNVRIDMDKLFYELFVTIWG